jgi:hypothetical protein
LEASLSIIIAGARRVDNARAFRQLNASNAASFCPVELAALLRSESANATDYGALLTSRGTSIVIAQDFRSPVCRWLRGRSDDHDSPALLNVIRVIFLLADVVRLFPGSVARFGLVAK